MRRHLHWAWVSMLLVCMTVAPDAGAEVSKPQACSLPIVVRATLLAQGTPEWSTVMIHHRDSGESRSYTINRGSNVLAPGVTLREIHKLAVIVDNRGRLERCTGQGHAFTGVAKQPDKSEGEPTKIDGSGLPKRLKGIFLALADAEKAGLSGVGGAARPGVQAAWTDKFSVPGISGGPQGQRAFQVGRLQKQSIYYRLGIRNFDVVKSINGIPFGSPKEASALMEKLEDPSSLTIQVQRRGKPVNIDVTLD